MEIFKYFDDLISENKSVSPSNISKKASLLSATLSESELPVIGEWYSMSDMRLMLGNNSLQHGISVVGVSNELEGNDGKKTKNVGPWDFAFLASGSAELKNGTYEYDDALLEGAIYQFEVPKTGVGMSCARKIVNEQANTILIFASKDRFKKKTNGDYAKYREWIYLGEADYADDYEKNADLEAFLEDADFDIKKHPDKVYIYVRLRDPAEFEEAAKEIGADAIEQAEINRKNKEKRKAERTAQREEEKKSERIETIDQLIVSELYQTAKKELTNSSNFVLQENVGENAGNAFGLCLCWKPLFDPDGIDIKKILTPFSDKYPEETHESVKAMLNKLKESDVFSIAPFVTKLYSIVNCYKRFILDGKFTAANKKNLYSISAYKSTKAASDPVYISEGKEWSNVYREYVKKTFREKGFSKFFSRIFREMIFSLNELCERILRTLLKDGPDKIEESVKKVANQAAEYAESVNDAGSPENINTLCASIYKNKPNKKQILEMLVLRKVLAQALVNAENK